MRNILTVFLSLLLTGSFTSTAVAIPFGDSTTWEGKYDADVQPEDIGKGDTTVEKRWIITGWGTNWETASSAAGGILNINTTGLPGAVHLKRFAFPGPGMDFAAGASLEIRAKVHSAVDEGCTITINDTAGRSGRIWLYHDKIYVKNSQNAIYSMDAKVNFHVYRIVFPNETNVQIYVDGAETPALDVPRYTGWEGEESDGIYIGNWASGNWDIDYVRWTRGKDVKEKKEANKISPTDAPVSSKPSEESVKEHGKGWKWDVNIYDRPGWYTPWIAGPKLIGDEILVQCVSHPDEAYANDFYADVQETVTLSSIDGGMSWRKTSNERFQNPPAAPPADGIMISVNDRVSSFSPELERERRKKLEEAGLSEVADKGWGGWVIFPDSMEKELKDKGYDVFAHHVAIPEGQAAVFSYGIKMTRSTDGGKTWEDSPIKGLPVFGHGPVYNGQTQLADGTRLWFYYGCEPHQTLRSIYVLRSTDQGKSWNTTKIPASPELSLTEIDVVSFPSGRVLLMIRCDVAGEGHIYSTLSDDSGLTWRPAKRTPMRGNPLLMLRLKSGAVLCTYGYRSWVPGGIRACLSRDEGETWDFENEKILRDDVIPSCWISPNGAPSVQLKDGTIFTLYAIQKADKLKPGDTAGGNVFRVQGALDGRWHCYVAGSRYTEDYVRPLP